MSDPETTWPPSVPVCSHVGLCVADLDAAVRFYVDGLGFELAERYDLDDSTVPGIDAALEVGAPVTLRSQMIRNGGMTVELLAYERPAPIGEPSTSRGRLGLTHLCFHVADVDAVAARLVGLGGAALPGTDTDVVVARLLFVADPDGNRIELMGPPAPRG